MMNLEQRSGVGVTNALFVDFSVREILDLAKTPVRLLESLSYLTPVKYGRDIQ